MVRAKVTPSRSANTISDYLGGRLLVRDPVTLGQVLEDVRAKWPVIEEENFLETPKAGYRAVHMQVEIAPGFTAELQLVPETIGRVQEKAHVLYNKWKRTTISPAQVKFYKRDMAKAEQIFAEAWVKSPFNLLQTVLAPKPARAGGAAVGEGGLPKLKFYHPPQTPEKYRTADISDQFVGDIRETFGKYHAYIVPLPRGSGPVVAEFKNLRNVTEAKTRIQEWVRDNPAQPAAELTSQGPQTVIPGAERTTGREFIEAQADKRIKGTKSQKAVDEGLFDVAGRGQQDMFSQPPRARNQEAWRDRLAPVTNERGPVSNPERQIDTAAGPARVVFPDELHARLYDLAGKPDKAETQALYDAFKGFVLERFERPSDVVALAREYRDELHDSATLNVTARGGKTEPAPFVVDPDRQAAYLLKQRPGFAETAEFYTFPGPISGLKQQWHRAANEIIDWLAEGKYSPFARYMGGYPFKDPTMGALPERGEYLAKRGLTQGAIYRTNRMAGRLNDKLRKASETDQRAALDYLTTANADPKTVPASVRGAAVAAKSSIKKLGRELVRRGLISQEAFDKHADAYLPRVYLKHLMERTGFGAGLKVSDQGYLKKRTDIPVEYRDLYLGEIKDVGFLVTKALSQPARDLAMIDFLRDLSRSPEWVLPESMVEWTAPGMTSPRKVTPYWLKSEADLLRRRAAAMPDLGQRARAKAVADQMDQTANTALGTIRGVPKDFRQMPDSPRYGDLRGLVVRKEIHDDIVGASGFWTGEKGAYDKTFDKLAKFNAFWKMMKVPFNPPTQIRNFVSNAVLLDMSGVPFERLPVLYARAFNEIRKNGKFYRIAVKHGVPASTFTAEELYRIRPDLLRVRGEKGGIVGKLSKMAEPLARLAKKPGDLYQFSETWGKTVKIIDAMEREGLSETKAVAIAQEALFDYSLVPNLVKSLRSRPIGAPFITFYYKAFPAVMKGAVKHPGKMAKYYLLPYVLGDLLVASLNDVDDDEVKKLRKALAQWMQDQGHVYIYPYRDESGRWTFTNFGYFLPWAMHERTARNTMEVATGEYGGSVNDFFSEVGVLGGPMPQIISAMQTGIDPFTGREIIKDTDPPREQMYKLMMYVWRMGGPSWLTDRGVVGHMSRSLTQTPNYYGDPPLSPEQAAARAVGVNIYPVDPIASRQRNIRRKSGEIKDQQRALRGVTRHKGLTPDQKQNLRRQYKAQIDLLVEDLRRYRKESAVHPNLR